mmetsp:Transcript_46757/g.84396  ORF Transcript_46757/g.84396 Transcript_46757/m.84396 type:complete len:399 (-) Transcript_46757:228-1424(-)|eukprot:CAMPEP_0115075832 /NCGR_PEP_ID=MMETSP0227-20121206/16090_1 /TAXON_ID=89957 /ORGANISM="Polarella glacialis, Strain CCMP 1383" /LENGTH=398 /DNA_ID=CAMNT_0002462905 /DNA_START=61 /DNA_END=1257 /DNA_ORIENTATION=-
MSMWYIAEALTGDSGGSLKTSYVNPWLPVSAVVSMVTVLLLASWAWPARPGQSLPWVLNPTGFVDHWGMHVLLCVVHNALIKETGDCIATRLCKWLSGGRTFEEGSDMKGKKLEVLEGIDIYFLCINHVVEYFTLHHVVYTFMTCGMQQRLSALTILNGPLAYVLLVTMNDGLYYAFHHTAHRRALYPQMHKQHHRNFVPWRGVADATNLHPLEQIAGITVFVTSLKVVSTLFGLHEAAGACFTISWAFMNIANHLTFDSQFHLPVPFPSYPQDHQMHHRMPMCNYSKLSSLFDRLFGTFQPYRPLGGNGMVPKKLDRPYWVPSVTSVGALAVALPGFAVLLEAFQAGSDFASADFSKLCGPVAVLALAMISCAAARSGPERSVEAVEEQTSQASHQD